MGFIKYQLIIILTNWLCSTEQDIVVSMNYVNVINFVQTLTLSIFLGLFQALHQGIVIKHHQ